MMKNVFRFIAKPRKSDHVKQLQNMTSQLNGINSTCIDLCDVRSSFTEKEKQAEKEFAKEALRLYQIVTRPSHFLKMQDASKHQPVHNAQTSSDNFMPGMITGFVVGSTLNSSPSFQVAENQKQAAAEDATTSISENSKHDTVLSDETSDDASDSIVSDSSGGGDGGSDSSGGDSGGSGGDGGGGGGGDGGGGGGGGCD